MASLRNDRTDLLPDVFCWTKFGAEAGEAAGSIFERKEVERQRNAGTFLWGIGQSVGPSLTQLLSITRAPEVLFSPIRSAPARRDVSPSSICFWSEGIGLDGRLYVLPENSLVTSRHDDKRPRGYHFALVCERSDPILAGADMPSLHSASLRNLVSGASVGSSQVTSIVRRITGVEEQPPGVRYPVAATAWLVPPYLIRLTRGLVVAAPELSGALKGKGSPLSIDELLRYRHAREGRRQEFGSEYNAVPTGERHKQVSDETAPAGSLATAG